MAMQRLKDENSRFLTARGVHVKEGAQYRGGRNRPVLVMEDGTVQSFCGMNWKLLVSCTDIISYITPRM